LGELRKKLKRESERARERERENARGRRNPLLRMMVEGLGELRNKLKSVQE